MLPISGFTRSDSLIGITAMTANQDTPPESTPPNRAIRKHKKDKDEIRYVPVQSIYKDLESMQLTRHFPPPRTFRLPTSR